MSILSTSKLILESLLQTVLWYTSVHVITKNLVMIFIITPKSCHIQLVCDRMLSTCNSLSCLILLWQLLHHILSFIFVFWPLILLLRDPTGQCCWECWEHAGSSEYQEPAGVLPLGDEEHWQGPDHQLVVHALHHQARLSPQRARPLCVLLWIQSEYACTIAESWFVRY